MTTTTTLVTVTTGGPFHGSTNLHCTGCQIVSGSLAPAIIGGLIGGFTVFVGVWCAEYLNRRREQTHRFRDEYWATLATSLQFFTDIVGLTNEEAGGRPLLFMLQLGRLRSAARQPQAKSKEKIAEVEALLKRFDIDRAVWRLGGSPPDMETVFGDRLSPLALHVPWWLDLWKRNKKAVPM